MARACADIANALVEIAFIIKQNRLKVQRWTSASRWVEGPRMGHTKLRLIATTTFLCLFSFAYVTVHAEPNGVFYGASATVQQSEALFEKSILGRFTSEDTEVEADSVISKTPLQWDGILGYRLNFADGTQFISLQAELALAGGAIGGSLEGVGTSPDRNELGEAWPEDWELETNRSHGLIMKYGIMRAILGTFDVSFYGLLGGRRTQIDFFSSFEGCFEVDGCSLDQLRAQSRRISPEINTLIGGVGIEAGLTGKTAIQFEIRRVEDADHDWVAEYQGTDWEVEARERFSVESTDFTAKVIRYF